MPDISFIGNAKAGKLGENGNGSNGEEMGAAKGSKLQVFGQEFTVGDPAALGQFKAAVKAAKTQNAIIDGVPINSEAGANKVLVKQLQLTRGVNEMQAKQLVNEMTQAGKAGKAGKSDRIPGAQGDTGRGGTQDGVPMTKTGHPDYRTKAGEETLPPGQQQAWQQAHSQHGQGQVSDPSHDARLKSNPDFDEQAHSQHGQGHVTDPQHDARLGSNVAAKGTRAHQPNGDDMSGKAARGRGSRVPTSAR